MSWNYLFPINGGVKVRNIASLGLQLVTSLVDQLDGEFKQKRDNGTEFTIKFTVTEKMNYRSVFSVR